jgi:hypothetical protein
VAGGRAWTQETVRCTPGRSAPSHGVHLEISAHRTTRADVGAAASLQLPPKWKAVCNSTTKLKCGTRNDFRACIWRQAEEALAEAQAAVVRARNALVTAEKRAEEAVKTSKIRDKEVKTKEEMLDKVRQAHTRAVVAAEVRHGWLFLFVFCLRVGCLRWHGS